MADKKPTSRPGQNSPGTRTIVATKSRQVFTEEERAAMREHAREVKAARSNRRRPAGADEEGEVLAKIGEMPERDRVMAERLHAIIKSCAPQLSSRTWYGMPAYTKDGNVVCFFQHSGKFKSRYSTLGFSDKAHLDDGSMWPTSFALSDLTATEEAVIVALVKRAVG